MYALDRSLGGSTTSSPLSLISLAVCLVQGNRILTNFLVSLLLPKTISPRRQTSSTIAVIQNISTAIQMTKETGIELELARDLQVGRSRAGQDRN